MTRGPDPRVRAPAAPGRLRQSRRRGGGGSAKETRRAPAGRVG